MSMENPNLSELVSMASNIVDSQRELYLTAAENLNHRYRNLLKKDFGVTLAQNCAWDLADTMASRYFGAADYYISPQQLVERITKFSYKNDYDPLTQNSSIKKILFENENNPEIIASINQQINESATHLFSNDRSKDSLDRKGKKQYRQSRIDHGQLTDDLTGREGTYHIVHKNGKDYKVSDLHADHIQPRETIQYSSRYVSTDKLDAMKEFYNSSDNFWLIHASANTSKGDVRVVIDKDGNTSYMSGTSFRNGCKNGTISPSSDITWRATPEQLAEATIAMWEKATPSGKKLETLQKEGYVDENGHVLPDIREKLAKKYSNALNSESLRMVLPHINADGKFDGPFINYKQVSKDASSTTLKSAKKIIAGQIIYYALPPVVYEAKVLLGEKDITLNRFIRKLKQSAGRIRIYMQSHLKSIFGNIVSNSLHKFCKCFFDIVVSLLRSTVRKMINTIKRVVLSLMQCVKIAASRQSSAAQKADAITKLLSTTIASIVLEVIFEWAEKQFSLPDLLMEPLQIITTILATNCIMLVLEKADLFHVRYGLMIANIDRIFDEEKNSYIQQSQAVLTEGLEQIESYTVVLQERLNEIRSELTELNLYEDSALEPLNCINHIFDMGIDFDQEWNEFVTFYSV